MLGLASLLKQYAPQVQFVVSNPVFDHEVRHGPGPHSGDNLKRYSLITLIGALLLVGAVWLAGRLAFGPFATRANTLTYVALTLMTLTLTLAADAYAVLATVSRVRHLIDSGQWDLLRLTALSGENILAAEYAVAQLRVWQVMLADTLFRLMGLVIVALLNPYTALTLLIALPVSLYLIVLAAAYLVEPRWRMQAVVAFSIAIATRIPDQTFALLAALGAVLTLRLAQLAVLGSLWFIAFRLLNTANSLFCILPVACLSAVYAFYLAYRALQRRSLRQALRFAIQAQ